MERPAVYMEYNRNNAVGYAHIWALKRNPSFLNFEKYGGDCTNFASQAIFAGSKIMNYSRANGWYYINGNNRTPSWTGVDFLSDFLTRNNGLGPFGEEVDIRDILPGDIIQLSFHGGRPYNHSLVVIQTGTIPGIDNILVATHTDDQDYYPLSNYNWIDIRFIHILGVNRS